jgi:hypothetical protein
MYDRDSGLGSLVTVVRLSELKILIYYLISTYWTIFIWRIHSPTFFCSKNTKFQISWQTVDCMLKRHFARVSLCVSHWDYYYSFIKHVSLHFGTQKLRSVYLLKFVIMQVLNHDDGFLRWVKHVMDSKSKVHQYRLAGWWIYLWFLLREFLNANNLKNINFRNLVFIS